jgi:phosphopantetheine--protein transferase-like protein
MVKKRQKNNSVGIDVVEVSRFNFFDEVDHAVKKIFSDYEIKYCLKHKDPSTHFAGIFAAKEAVSKTLGTEKFPFIEIEIRHAKDGSPEVWNKSKKIKVRVSITHTSMIAIAVALS